MQTAWITPVVKRGLLLVSLGVVVVTLGLYSACSTDRDEVAAPQEWHPANSAVPAIAVTVDIKPGACPNPLSLAAQGQRVKKKKKRVPQATLQVALMGAADFDVRDVDPTTLRMEFARTVRDPQARDVGSVGTDPGCDAFLNERDGIKDLVVPFDRFALIRELRTWGVNAGDVVEVWVWGELTDGTPFEGMDEVTIVGRVGPRKKKVKKKL